MARLNISWVLPTLRESGKPLAVSDIDKVALAISADGVDFQPLGSYPPNVLSTFVDDVDYGEWFIEGIVYDKNGRPSAPVVKSIVRTDTTPPGALAITLSLS